MVFITDHPFLDPFNTYASVEPLDSWHFAHSFTFIFIIKDWNYLINFTLLRFYFWIFFPCCDNTIFFTTIHWIVSAIKSIYTFLKNPIYFFSIVTNNMPTFHFFGYLVVNRRMDFSVGFPSFSIPSLTFSSSVDNIENVLDCRRVNCSMTTILENNIFTASSELTTYRRSYDF